MNGLLANDTHTSKRQARRAAAASTKARQALVRLQTSFIAVLRALIDFFGAPPKPAAETPQTSLRRGRAAHANVKKRTATP